jgi:dipeptidase D
VVALPNEHYAAFERLFGEFAEDVRKEFSITDSGLTLTLTPSDSCPVVDSNTTHRLLAAVVGLPNGVQAMSASLEGLVETSTNLASVKMEGCEFVITTSQRSSVESAKRAVAQAVSSVFELAGASVCHSDGYPGWAPNTSSRVLQTTADAYRRLFATEPVVRAIHAGLECGLFLEKYPSLDMVSFGPTLRGVHSPDERLEIATVDKFWRLLVEVLAQLR